MLREPGMVLAGTGVVSARALSDNSGFGKLHRDLDRMPPAAAMRIADRHAAKIGPDRIVDIALLDLVIFEIVLIDGDTQARRAVLEAVVIVDDEGDVPEDAANLTRNGAARLGIGTIDFGEQRRNDRRPRRDFDNLDRRSAPARRGLSASREFRARSHGWRGCAHPSARD